VLSSADFLKCVENEDVVVVAAVADIAVVSVDVVAVL